MKLIVVMALGLVWCLSSYPAWGQEVDLPAGAEVIFAPTPGASTGSLAMGGAQAALGSVSAVPVEGQPFTHAYRVTTREAGQARWSVQFKADLPETLEPDRAYLLRVYARCIDSTTGDGVVQAKIERNTEPWLECISRGLSFGAEWRRFDFPFEFSADRSFPAGQTQLTFHLGAERQTIEIGGIALLGFGPGVAVESLPRSRVTYEGSEPDAAWRQEAEARIDRYRKGDLRIIVRDAEGRPVPGATVLVEQQRHAFAFGAALNLNFLASDDPRVPAYREAFADRFNAVVFENELKWYGPGLRNREAVKAGLAFAEEHDLFVRGHVLIWPGMRHVPGSVRSLVSALRADPDDEASREALRAAVEERIDTMAKRLAGRVDDWDVVNEAFAHHDVMDVLNAAGTPHGAGVMVDWFKRARRADPGAKLYLNDYGILTAGSVADRHQTHFYETAQNLLDRGAPLDGLGMQAHFGSSLTPPTKLWSYFDRFAALGLPIKVTEFDINLDDPVLKADYTRDFYTAAFAHPSVNGILSWGFWAGRHWRPDAAYLNPDFSSRPSDEALRGLLFERWWTDLRLETDTLGEASARVFRGQHRVTISAPGQADVTIDEVTVDDRDVDLLVRLNSDGSQR